MQKRNLTCLLILGLVLMPPFLSRAQQRGQGVRIKVENNQEVDLYKASYALIIGVSEYTNCWPKLPGVKRDVTEVSAVLREHGFVVTTVNNPTWTQLDQAIRKFITDYGQGGDNRLLIYFAGHGHTLKTVSGQQGYIVPADTPDPNHNEAAFKDRAISMDDIKAYVQRIEAKHVLWLFDSCFSGSLFEATRAIPPAITSRTAQPVRQFITAGTADQRVPDNSIFRDQFVKGLRGEADGDKDGFITGDELALYLKNTLTNYSDRAQEPQSGKIRNPDLDKGDFVFALPETAASNPTRQSTPTPQSTPTSTLDTATVDLALWQSAERGNTIADYEEYLRQSPSGRFVQMARNRLAQLRKDTAQADDLIIPSVFTNTATVEPVNRIDLTGEWLATYPEGPLRVQIQQSGGNVKATLITGNSYVPAGKTTFSGKFTSNPFFVQQTCAQKAFTNPFYSKFKVTIIDNDHFRMDPTDSSCGSETITFTRVIPK
jgi:Caspase domain